MRYLFFAALIYLAVPALTSADDVVATTQPATELEAYSQATDILLVQDRYAIAELKTKSEATIAIEAWVVSSPGHEADRRRGVRVLVIGGDKPEVTAFIDLDELVAGSTALAQMSGLRTTWQNEVREFTDVRFATRGGFGASFVQDGTHQTALVRMDSKPIVLNDGGLADLKAAFDKAITVLQAR